MPPAPAGTPPPAQQRAPAHTLALAAALAALPAIALRAAPGSEVIDGARAQVRALEAELVRLDAQAGAAAAAHAAAQGASTLSGAHPRGRRPRCGRPARPTIAVQRLSDRLVSLYVESPRRSSRWS